MSCTQGTKSIAISALEGAWWSDTTAATADFAIHDSQIWLEYDSQYHPLKIEEGGILVYDLGPELGRFERIIVVLDEDKLILKDDEGQTTTYVRRE